MHLRAFFLIVCTGFSIASLFCLFSGQIVTGLIVLAVSFVLLGAGIAYGLEPLDVETELGQAD